MATTVQVTINGQTYSLTETSAGSGVYSATLTSPAASSYPQTGHYFPVSVTVTDSYGNTATADDTDPVLGDSLKLYNVEKVKPVVSISAPASGAHVTTATPALTLTAADDANQQSGASGLDLSSATITLDGTTYNMSTVSAILDFDSQRDVTIVRTTAGGDPLAISLATTFVGLTDGQHTLSITIPDFDGNASVAATSTFTVDTVAPALNVTAPTQGYQTNVQTWTVSGITSDQTSNPVTVTVKLDGVDQGAVTVGQDGSFTKTGSYATEGSHTFTIRATDAAGKYSEETRTVTYSTTLPVIESVVINPNPTDAGTTYTITVTVS